jgi:chromosome segregation ATPase
MYCFNDNQLICYVCAASSHSRHELEALDVAQKRLSPTLKNQMKTLQQKKHKFEEFRESVEKQKPQIQVGAQTALQAAKEKMANLRKILDDKEKELEEAIKRMEETKKSSAQNEINKANERIETINKCLAALSEALNDKKEPLDSLLAVEEMEEQIRHSCIVVKKKNIHTYNTTTYTPPPSFVCTTHSLIQKKKTKG